MAQISVPIKIEGLDFVIGVIKGVKDRVEFGAFKNDVSDDYKNGYIDSCTAIITVLEQLMDGDAE